MKELSREEIELISHLPHCFSPFKDIDIRLSVLYRIAEKRKKSTDEEQNG